MSISPSNLDALKKQLDRGEEIKKEIQEHIRRRNIRLGRATAQNEGLLSHLQSPEQQSPRVNGI